MTLCSIITTTCNVGIISHHSQYLYLPNMEKASEVHFLRLPREIRNQIYVHYFDFKKGRIELEKDHCGTAVLRACRQTHQEATEVLYGGHTFYTSDARMMRRGFPAPYFVQIRQSCAACGGTHDYETFNGVCIRFAPWLHSIGFFNMSMIQSFHVDMSHGSFATLPKGYLEPGYRLSCKDAENPGFLLKIALNMLTLRARNLRHLRVTFEPNVLGVVSLTEEEEEER